MWSNEMTFTLHFAEFLTHNLSECYWIGVATIIFIIMRTVDVFGKTGENNSMKVVSNPSPSLHSDHPFLTDTVMMTDRQSRYNISRDTAVFPSPHSLSTCAHFLHSSDPRQTHLLLFPVFTAGIASTAICYWFFPPCLWATRHQAHRVPLKLLIQHPG